MPEVTYTDERGRKFLVRIPEGVTATEEEIMMGIWIGPPDIVDSLDWPEEFKVRLHNILFKRKLFNSSDLKRRGALRGAVMEALKVDTSIIAEAYHNYEQEPNF